jgi:hypothetical protein
VSKIASEPGEAREADAGILGVFRGGQPTHRPVQPRDWTHRELGKRKIGRAVLVLRGRRRRLACVCVLRSSGAAAGGHGRGTGTHWRAPGRASGLAMEI